MRYVKENVENPPNDLVAEIERQLHLAVQQATDKAIGHTLDAVINLSVENGGRVTTQELRNLKRVLNKLTKE